MSNLNRRKFIKSLTSFSMLLITDRSWNSLKQNFPLLSSAEDLPPETYTSTCRECPVGCGVMLKVQNGYVIKIEGNPNHPINHGGLCQRGGAALLELYNVERLRTPLRIPAIGAIEEISWERAFSEIRGQIKEGKTAFLTGHISGSLYNFIDMWFKTLDQKTDIIVYEASKRLAANQVNDCVFNQPVHFPEQNDRIISLGSSDTLDQMIQARDFEELIQQMESGEISNLFIYKTNPILTYPDHTRLSKALKKVPLKIVFVTSINETASQADYVFPIHHWIESWGIDVPAKNVFSLLQPAIDPVLPAKSIEEILVQISPKQTLFERLDIFYQLEWEKIFKRLSPNVSFEDNWYETLIAGGMWEKNAEFTAWQKF